MTLLLWGDRLRLSHGGNIPEFAGRYRKREGEITDFSTNVNPFGVPDAAASLYPHLEEALGRYPDPLSGELCGEIARQFPVSVKNVLAGNGAAALLALAIRVLKPRRALIFEPCFTEYRRLLELEGTKVRSLALREADDFRFRRSGRMDELRGMDLAVVGHPNNPTGTAFSRNEMLEFLGEARRRRVFVIADEAFADWCPGISVADRIRENSGFIVIRSLTKFYGLAGIRAGFALGPRRWIERMKNSQEVWSCNRLAEKLSVAALRDRRFCAKTRKWFREEAAWLFESLKSIPFLKVYPSLANFFLARLKTGTGQKSFFDFLGRRGIYVRQTADFWGLNGTFFRSAIRLRRDNQYLVKSLKEWAGR